MIIITMRRKNFTLKPWGGRMGGFVVGGWFGVSLCIIFKWTSTAKEWVAGISKIRQAVEYTQHVDTVFEEAMKSVHL